MVSVAYAERAWNSRVNHTELVKQEVELMSRPRMLFVELTRACNLSCPMCRPHVLAGSHLAMPDEVLARVEKELFPYVECVDLRGWGESTLDARLPGIIDRLSMRKIRVNLFTNLTTKDEAFWQSMAHRDVNLSISLEAATPGTYEQFRRGASFERFVLNLEALMKEWHNKNIHNDVYFSVVVSDENLQELPRIIELASRYCVPLVRLNPICLASANTSPRSGTRGYPRIGVSTTKARELETVLQTTLEIARTEKVRVQLAANIAPSRAGAKRNEGKVCVHPWTYALVRCDGGIVFCDHLDSHPNAVMGNILQRSFMDTWNSNEYQQLRREHRGRRFDRLRRLGIECDWCYENRYADCEYLFEPDCTPLDLV